MTRALFKGAALRSRGSSPKGPSASSNTGTVKAIVPKDFAILAALPVSVTVAWTMPERSWRPIGKLFSPITAKLLAQRSQSTVTRIGRLVGARALPIPPTSIVEDSIAGHVEEYIQILREHRPLGWHPNVRLHGREHLDAALETKRGAILWVGHFTFASLVAKRAFHESGIPVSHLSHPSHGFSRSRFGMRFLNPIRTRVEDRYLGERIMLALDGSTAALRQLHKRLRRNGVVSITVRERAQRPNTVPFLDGTIKLATGAADLAFATGAALLPVFTVREPDGSFRVVIEGPLNGDGDLPRQEAADLMLREYARRLEPHVLTYPGQWRGWLHM